jgi:hypothetical protein
MDAVIDIHFCTDKWFWDDLAANRTLNANVTTKCENCLSFRSGLAVLGVCWL